MHQLTLHAHRLLSAVPRGRYAYVVLTKVGEICKEGQERTGGLTWAHCSAACAPVDCHRRVRHSADA